jgi:hypothetical protein
MPRIVGWERVEAPGANGVRDDNCVLESICWLFFWSVAEDRHGMVGMVAVVALIVAAGNRIGGEEGVRAVVEHGRCNLLHEVFCLQVQIPHHGTVMPAAKHSNGVMVDSTAEEGHSAPRAKGSSTYISQMQTCLT